MKLSAFSEPTTPNAGASNRAREIFLIAEHVWGPQPVREEQQTHDGYEQPRVIVFSDFPDKNGTLLTKRLDAFLPDAEVQSLPLTVLDTTKIRANDIVIIDTLLSPPKTLRDFEVTLSMKPAIYKGILSDPAQQTAHEVGRNYGQLSVPVENDRVIPLDWDDQGTIWLGSDDRPLPPGCANCPSRCCVRNLDMEGAKPTLQNHEGNGNEVKTKRRSLSDILHRSRELAAGREVASSADTPAISGPVINDVSVPSVNVPSAPVAVGR